MLVVARTLLAIAFAAALVYLPGGAASAAPAGTVVGLSGNCFIESGGSRDAARMGQPLQVGDTLDVPSDSKLKLRLGDGSVISVASGTRMTIAALSVDASGQRREAKLSLANGLLRAVVAPVERPAKFEVDTAVGVAAVRSTDWFVEASANAMQVGVLTGSVEMTSAATKHGVQIPARWGSRLEGPGALRPIPPSLAVGQQSLQPQARPAANDRIGLDPVPPRVWSQAEFAAVIARTDIK